MIEAARIAQAEGLGPRISIVGVDLVGMFLRPEPDLDGLWQVEASLRTWHPRGQLDLITCVHGLHYVGDKVGLIARAVSWLAEDGLFLANLSLENLKVADDPKPGRRTVAEFRPARLRFDRKRRWVAFRGRREPELPFRYLGPTIGPGRTPRDSPPWIPTTRSPERPSMTIARGCSSKWRRKCIAPVGTDRRGTAVRCRRLEAIREGRLMFLFYFKKLGLLSSIMVSVALTFVLIVAFRLIGG